MGGTAYKKARLAVCFMIFSAGIPSRRRLYFGHRAWFVARPHRATPEAEEYIARTFGAEQSYIVTNEHRRRTKLWVCTPRHPAVRCDRPQLS